MNDDADRQLIVWPDQGGPKPRPASDEEKHAALNEGVTMALRHHHGPVPRVCGINGDWTAFRATLIEYAWGRMKNFEHGGKKTLKEFAYIAAYFTLRDIQRVMMGVRRDPETGDFAPCEPPTCSMELFKDCA